LLFYFRQHGTLSRTGISQAIFGSSTEVDFSRRVKIPELDFFAISGQENPEIDFRYFWQKKPEMGKFRYFRGGLSI